MGNPSTDELKEKGNEAYKAKKYSDAVKFYSEGLQLDPYSHTLFSNRAAAYAAQGDYEKSLKDAEKSIQIDPKWLKGWLRKAQAHEKMGKLEDAMKAYTKARDLAPKDESVIESLMKCSGLMMFNQMQLNEEVSDDQKRDTKRYNKLSTKDAVQEIKRLLNSTDGGDLYDATYLVDSHMGKEGEQMLKELEKNTEIYGKLVNLACQSYSGKEYKETGVRATVGLSAIAMMQAKKYLATSNLVNETIMKGMAKILVLNNEKQTASVINALSIITMYDQDGLSSSPLCAQVLKEDIVDKLVSVIRQDNPPDMNSVYTACRVLGRLCKSRQGRKEILGKGVLEAVCKVATAKVTGLEKNVSFGPLDTLLETISMPGMEANQHSAVDAMIDMGYNYQERTHDKEVCLNVVRLGGIKALISSITSPGQIFGRILTGARFMGTVANILNLEEPSYRKLFCKQIEFSQLTKLMLMGDNPKQVDYRFMIVGDGKNQESQLFALKSNVCQVVATMASSSDDAHNQVIESGMLGYILNLALESNGAMNAISILVKHPEIAQVVFAHKDFSEAAKNIPYEEDEVEWGYAITYTLQTLQHLTAYKDYCIEYMAMPNVIDCLARHSRKPERKNPVAKIIENMGGQVIHLLSAKGKAGTLQQLNKVLNSNGKIPAEVRSSMEATVQAIKSGKPNPNVVQPQPPVKARSTVNKVKMCGLPSCPNVEKEGDKFKKCGRCLEIAYCSQECQKTHWKIHKSICIPKVNTAK